MDDFLDVVRPQLEALQDDPERGPPEITSTTTSPVDIYDIDDARRVEQDEEGTPYPVADDSIPENTEAAREAARDLGLDVLAFYKSFRFFDLAPFKGKWGIFLLDAGVAAVAAEFRAHTPALPAAEAQRLAMTLLYEHERYHFWIDAWAISQECVPLMPKLKRYEYYFASKSTGTLEPINIEESLANGFAFRRVTRDKLGGAPGISATIRAFLRQCPEPYSEFDMNATQRRDSEGLLAGSVLSGLPPWSQLLFFNRTTGDRALHWGLGQTLRPDVRLYPLSEPKLCPIYFVNDSAYAARIQPYRAPDRREFRTFVEAYLGGQHVAATDHSWYKIDNGEKIKFPNPHDKTIQKHERDSILRKAGMRLPEERLINAFGCAEITV
ncbi:MAG: hypothetical protein JJT81_14570 [Rubellimicrobium sp.]|nr:hypothetical protein [Rubellimicrobium sp.]